MKTNLRRKSLVGTTVALSVLALTFVPVPAKAETLFNGGNPAAVVYFDVNKSNLPAQSQDVLQAAIPQLANSARVVVIGYVQRSHQPRVWNTPLSYQRAESVAFYLQREIDKYLAKQLPKECAGQSGKAQALASTQVVARLLARTASFVTANGNGKATPTATPTPEETATPTPAPEVTATPSPSETPNQVLCQLVAPPIEIVRGGVPLVDGWQPTSRRADVYGLD